MNRSINNTILIVLVLAFCFSMLPVNISNASYAEERFKIDVNIGFDGYAIKNMVTPIRIEIQNNFKDIDGSKIQLMVEDKFNQKSYYTAYSKKINIAKGSTKIINMESIFYKNSNLFIRILDNSNNMVFEKKVKYLNLDNPDILYMGIFSESVDSLRYLSKTYSKVNHNNNRLKYSEIAKLDENMSENYKTLEMFGVIIINNYDTEMLNSNQKEALKKWVESGGLLLIGTGPNYQKNLKGLENINFIDVTGTKEIEISELGWKEALKSIDAKLDEGEKIVIDDKEKLPFYHKKMGEGYVVIASFDLGLKPFSNWDENDEFINKIVNKYLNEDMYSYKNAISTSPNWANNIIAYLPYNFLPSIRTIIIILVLFILLVGPINYVILKRLDKRELIWLTVPMIVILLSSLIYVLGFKTRLREPIANNVSIISIDENINKASIITKSGIMGFKNGDWNIAFNKESEVFLDDRRDHDILQRFSDKEVVTEYIYDDGKHVIFKKAGILDVEAVTIKDEIDLNNGISNDFRFKDGKIVGTINNLSNLDLEDAVMFYGNTYENLGDLKTGEKSNEIILSTNTSNTVKDWYAVIGMNRGYVSSRINGDVDDILNKNIKRDILQQLFNSGPKAINQNRFFMIAWNRDEVGKGIKINNKEAKRLDRNLILIPLSIKYEKGDTVKVPYGVLYPEIVDIHDMMLEGNRSMIHGDGYVVLAFKPQENMTINSMKINYDISKYRGELYIYNFVKKDWEKRDKNDTQIDASNMDKYYDENEGVLIKFDPTDNVNISIPDYTVEGVIE